MNSRQITEGDLALIKSALAVLEPNYDGHTYRHTVGAALRCANGKIYSGVNCDSLHGVCAEFVVMGMAVSAGEREFETIVAVKANEPNSVLSPCGNCRQMLLEYSPSIQVLINDQTGRLIKVGIQTLLPYAYKREI